MNCDRYVLAEKHLRHMLTQVDDTSAIDRLALRRMLINCLRLQGRPLDAARECQREDGDGVEAQVELLVLRSFLLMRPRGGEPPHEPLNKAAELCGKLEDGSLSQARWMAIIFALQVDASSVSFSLSLSQWRLSLGLRVSSQWKQGNLKLL
jgi:hypothetical protein